MNLPERFAYLKSRLDLLVEERNDDPIEALLFWISERCSLSQRQPLTQLMLNFVEPIHKLRYEATVAQKPYQNSYRVNEKIIDAFYSLFMVTLLSRCPDNDDRQCIQLAFRFDCHGRVDQCVNVIGGSHE